MSQTRKEIKLYEREREGEMGEGEKEEREGLILPHMGWDDN